MKKERQLLALFGTYSAILLLSAVIGITVIIFKRSVPPEKVTETVTEKEYVYVYADTAVTSSSEEITDSDKGVWIVKEYEEIIGVFSEDGKLLYSVSVYTKTLPEADQRLLREGIKLTSLKELRALIEDYSS